MFKLIIALCATALTMTGSQAQNIWGAEAAVGQQEGQFDTDFVQTEELNSLSDVSWNALTIDDTNGERIPGAAYWTKNLSGFSQGAYANGNPQINSPSQSNGVGIFDSDYLDSDGTIGALGTGSSPAVHRGELISPIIDLTGYTDEVIMVNFYTQYRNFKINLLGFSISTDDGVNWSDPINFNYLQINESYEGYVRFDLPESTLEGISNLSAVRVKFIFDGNYYFVMVDDLTIQVSDLIFSAGF